MISISSENKEYQDNGDANDNILAHVEMHKEIFRALKCGSCDSIFLF